MIPFRFPSRLTLVAALAVSLTACDTADLEDPATDLDDAAVVVAGALALDAGGVLEDAAAAAAFAGATGTARTAGPDRPGCRGDRSYDEAAGLWTVAADCERASPDGRFSASFQRVSTYQFLGADGTPQQSPRGAAVLEADVLSGSSLFRSPHRTHALTSLTSDLTVTRLDADLVSVSGTYGRAATDTLRGARGERTVAYDLDLVLDDVQGPRGTARQWRQAVGGSISGTLVATITRTAAGGNTETRTVDRAFTVTFPTDASGGRVAEIALGGRRYRADVTTGEVAGF